MNPEEAPKKTNDKKSIKELQLRVLELTRMRKKQVKKKNPSTGTKRFIRKIPRLEILASIAFV